MKHVFTRQWLKAAAIRAIRTIAQTAIASIGTSVFLHDVNWLGVLSVSALAGVLSILTSLAGLPEVTYEVEAEEAKQAQIEAPADDTEADDGD